MKFFSIGYYFFIPFYRSRMARISLVKNIFDESNRNVKND